MNRLAVLCVLFATFASVWAGQFTPAAVRVLTLEQALALALEHNRVVKNAVLEVERSEDRVAALRTSRLPAFDFNLFEAQLLTRLDFEFKQGVFGAFPSPTGPLLNPPQDTQVGTGRVPSTFVLAGVKQPLSQLYRIGLGVRLGELESEIAKEKLRSQSHSMANEVKSMYYRVLQVQSGLDATEETLKLYREVDRLTERYVAQQVALRSDSLEVKTRLAQAEYEALKLRNASASLKEQLNRLIGRDIRAEFRVSPVPDIPAVEVNVGTARTRALEQRPEIKEARLKLEQARYDKRLKKSEYIPDVSLSFHYLSMLNVEVLPTHVSALGIMVNWEPFDWGRKKQELAEKTRVIQQATNALEEAEELILIDVNTRSRKLQETRALLGVAQLGQEAAREKLRVVTNEYSEQAALIKDVLENQAQVAAANHQFQEALLSFWTARAEFEKATGEE